MERVLDREMAGFYRYLYIDRPSPINEPFWYCLPRFCMLSMKYDLRALRALCPLPALLSLIFTPFNLD
jgi:hypothetical protein